MNETPNIAVTGADGFLGSHVVSGLPSNSVLKIAHRLRGRVDNRLVVADLAVRDALPILPPKIETIFHFAGKLRANEEEELGILKNIILMAERAQVRRIVYSSSCSVYGEQPAGQPIDEEAALSPLTSYAHGKAKGEDLLQQAAAKSGVDIVVLRLFNPYGERQAAEMVVPRMISAARRNEPIEINGDGSQVRDFVHVHDVAAAAMATLGANGSFNVFNVASGRATSIREIAAEIESTTGSRAGIAMKQFSENDMPRELNYSVANIDKLKTAFSWSPQINFEEGIRELCQICSQGEFGQAETKMPSRARR